VRRAERGTCAWDWVAHARRHVVGQGAPGAPRVPAVVGARGVLAAAAAALLRLLPLPLPVGACDPGRRRLMMMLVAVQRLVSGQHLQSPLARPPAAHDARPLLMILILGAGMGTRSRMRGPLTTTLTALEMGEVLGWPRRLQLPCTIP
jgi:hypothetical protein